MHYVGLDGCQIVADSTDMISAFVGFKNKITRQQARGLGLFPGYGWGWKKLKPVSYLQKGLLFEHHFIYIYDYYNKLSERDPASGRLIRTYDDARRFALDPLGAGYGGPSGGTGPMHNAQGEDFDYTGCYTCFFDDF